MSCPSLLRVQIYEDAGTAAAGAAAEKAAEEAFVAARGSPTSVSPAANNGVPPSKTPRAEVPFKSPNQRLRKARRAEELQHPAAHKVPS